MNRAKHLIDRVTDLDNLYLAFWKAKKGKNYSREVWEFRQSLEANLQHLRKQIESGVVEVGNYRYFRIWEPKERKICAAAFKEQVLHHALMNVCHDYFERAQIYDSYASRKHKGTYAALEKAHKNTHLYPWFIKLDVQKFFESIHHDVLKVQLNRMCKDFKVLDILYQIIDSYEASPDRGLPIGNLTSQYFANHYLSSLDHYIKERLHIKAYVRYMDDMVLWHHNKYVLIQAEEAIRDYVSANLRCNLKPSTLNKSESGLSFLGYRVYPHYLHLTQQSKRRFIHKFSVLQQNYDNGNWSEAKCQRHALSLFSFVQHADTLELRKKLLLPFQG